MSASERYTGAWGMLLLAALLTGILAGGVLWPAPFLAAAFGKAAWFFPLFLLALSLQAFVSGSLRRGLSSNLSLLLVFPATLLLLAAGEPKLAGSIGAAFAHPLLVLFGPKAVWVGGFAFLLLFVIAFVRSLLTRRESGSELGKYHSGNTRIVYPGYASTPEERNEHKKGNTLPRRSEAGYRFSTGISRRDIVLALRKQAKQSGRIPPLLSVVDEQSVANWYAARRSDSDPPQDPDVSEKPGRQPEEGPLVKDAGSFAIERQKETSPDTPPESDDYAALSESSPEAIPQVEPLFSDTAEPASPSASEVDAALAPCQAGDDSATAELRTDSAYVPTQSYRKPDASLLVKSHERIDEDTRAQMQQTAETLEKTFFEFGIEARVSNICRGPVITQYEISVSPGIRLSRVVALQDNIALNLAAASIRIEAPIPGKSAIGIEVPNRKRSMVTLRDILESPEFQQSSARIPLALGQTVSGAPLVADLAAMPHLIIAGTTGSGKSVCVNSIICSILYNMRPSQVRFILVDPKYVEMAPYNGIPHLLIPVINKPRAAILALKWLVREMESRYQSLQALGARSLESYNDKLAKEQDALDPETGQALERMPYLVLVIDELADLMLLAAKEIEDSISRLAAMSRAVGIHLIFATQRPSVDVLTGVIKNNFPARIAFQVASTIDSRTILDTKGADKLLGKGDSLFIGPGSPAALRIQGAFLSEAEVEKTAEYLRSLGTPLYRMDILDEADEQSEEEKDDFIAEDDPLFNEAIQIVIQTQRASASYIQRRLKVGYNRAARMIERMETEGIIGPQLGSKPREVLVSSWP